jgi:mRNA interferase MazF
VSGAEVGRLALRLVVPITEWKTSYANYSWMVRLDPDAENGLTKTSAADVFQMRSASLQRFGTYVGALPQERMERIKQAIEVCVEE